MFSHSVDCFCIVLTCFFCCTDASKSDVVPLTFFCFCCLYFLYNSLKKHCQDDPQAFCVYFLFQQGKKVYFSRFVASLNEGRSPAGIPDCFLSNLCVFFKGVCHFRSHFYIFNISFVLSRSSITVTPIRSDVSLHSLSFPHLGSKASSLSLEHEATFQFLCGLKCEAIPSYYIVEGFYHKLMLSFV